MAKTKRTAVIQYVQQVKYLPEDPVAFFKKKMENIRRHGYPINQYAFILHDKDVHEDGSSVANHYHLVIIFKKRVSVDGIARVFGDDPSHFEIMTKRGNSTSKAITNSLMYLIHGTMHAKGKHQYDPSDVVSNFDYVKFVNQQHEQHKLVTSDDDLIKRVLMDLAALNINKKQAIAKIMLISPIKFANNKRKIDDIFSGALSIEHLKWINKKREQKKPIKIMWFFGKSGTGKTRMALYLTEQLLKRPYFITGDQNDAMQEYQGQHVIIWEELRENISYPQLLRVLDPWLYEKPVASRYFDKQIMPDVLLITTPYSPLKLYQYMNISNKRIDGFDHLVRRVPTIYCFQDNAILLQKWKPELEKYVTQRVCKSANSLVHHCSDDELIKDFFDI